ncbi:heterokaryon incompatibility protein-domain-containing protein [Triangularia verruculosa]|uniref:Heterokaryon incompatibility protein-domain-containing protein n=1 Tax=Triangularia verruculosa TaxID=2587418 RepID=A0AAN6XXN2_9PEZI|nr:heterokaryon incompatibility protein-domain-containing protein [Triangularia verruculosa]
MDAFSYLPLNHDIREIRLITLHYPDPTSGEEPTGCTSTVPPPIKLTLSHVSLDAQPAPDYSALSYVWGDANDMQSIILDGQTFQVTHNLFTALERLYADGFSGKIWIDAICINQSDNDEKAVQVQLMTSIYSRAEEVFIWLGPGPDGGALQTIARLSALFQGEVMNKYRAGKHDFISLRDTFIKNVVDLAVEDQGQNDRTDGFDFEAIFRLCTERQWWRRVWVIQELVLAKKATVLCGVASASWKSVADCVASTFSPLWVSRELSRDIPGRLREIANSISRTTIHLIMAGHLYQRSLEQADWNKDRAGVTLIDALDTIYGAQRTDGALSTSDQRDMIYGILGIIRPEDRFKIAVDYSDNMTLEKILFEVGRVVLVDRGPDVLARRRSSSASLPSWVIEWKSKAGFCAGVADGNTLRKKNDFDASKGRSWENWSSKCQIEQASYAAPQISLLGRIITQVATVGRKFKYYDFPPKNVNDIRQWLLELMEMLESHQLSQVDAIPSASNDISRELLSRTLDNIWRVPIMDRNDEKRVNDENKAILIAGFDALMGKRQPPPEIVGDEEKKAWVLAESRDYRHAWGVGSNLAVVDGTGRPGLTENEVQVDDQVVIFAGGHVPFVIRPVEDMGGGGNIRYRLVSAAYIYGLMDGEAMEGDPDFEEIWLV